MEEERKEREQEERAMRGPLRLEPVEMCSIQVTEVTILGHQPPPRVLAHLLTIMRALVWAASHGGRG